MAGVTSIHENIIEKHYTGEEGVLEENNAEPSLKHPKHLKNTIWPEMPFKPTASFRLENRRFRFFWKSLGGNTRSLQPHLGSIHHWVQLQKIPEALLSSRFERSRKRNQKVTKWKRNTRGREILHTIYMSFWSGVSTTNIYSAMLSLGTALTGVGVVPPGGLAGV